MVKILNLVLYSDNNESYVKMYNIVTNYNNFYNIKTFFYKYDNTIDNDIEFVDNIIKIKGEETMMPGILDKTIVALKSIKNIIVDYDYVIRTNISSIVNFKLLREELEKNPITYYGGTYIINLCKTDIPYGIIDNKHFNTPFASGTNIILSKKGYELLIDNSHLLDRTIIDDVSIGILFKKLNIGFNHIPNKFVVVPILSNDLNSFKKILEKKYIVYRNHNGGNRRNDVLQMNILTELLMSNS